MAGKLVGAKKLTQPCCGYSTAGGRYVLKRLRSGDTPRPHVTWPLPDEGVEEASASGSD